MDTWTVTRASRRRLLSRIPPATRGSGPSFRPRGGMRLGGGAAALLLAAALSGASPATAAPPTPAANAKRPAAAATSPVVTLITGDKVRLIAQPGGQQAVG